MSREASIPPWWLILPVLLIVGNAIALNASSSTASRNGIYQASVLISGVVTAFLMGGYVLLAARLSHVDARAALALDPPANLRRAGGLVVLAIVVITLTGLALEPLLHGDRKQGLTPTRLPHGGEWLALAVALVLLGMLVPLAEELLFRGLGFAAVQRFAVPVTATAFAIAHGLPALLPPVFVAGLALGELRRRTGSLWPGVAAHATVNVLGILAALLAAG
ncbi:MAG: protease family protein [Gaiellales bacterium]|nr:protease family protein [Gaiellales bacterium]